MRVVRIPLGPMGNNSYLIIDDESKEAAVVDPSFDSETLLPIIEANGVVVRYVLLTHAHFDHIVGVRLIAENTGAPVALHAADLPLMHALVDQGRMFGLDLEEAPEPEMFLEGGQEITLGSGVIRVIDTPGHSPGGVTFLVDDSAIAGDCLFRGSIGRTDLPGASSDLLMKSIREGLLTLPDATVVLPGHGDPTTIGAERRTNPFLRG